MQNDAHLPRRGAEQFYKLYLSLIDYVNQKYEINLDVGKIEKQEETNPELIKDIDDYLWKHKNVIDEYTNGKYDTFAAIDEGEVGFTFYNSI